MAQQDGFKWTSERAQPPMGIRILFRHCRAGCIIRISCGFDFWMMVVMHEAGCGTSQIRTWRSSVAPRGWKRGCEVLIFMRCWEAMQLEGFWRPWLFFFHLRSLSQSQSRPIRPWQIYEHGLSPRLPGWTGYLQSESYANIQEANRRNS
jgi:hypothetical protein